MLKSEKKTCCQKEAKKIQGVKVSKQVKGLVVWWNRGDVTCDLELGIPFCSVSPE
jgi:hypothetical protein